MYDASKNPDNQQDPTSKHCVTGKSNMQMLISFQCKALKMMGNSIHANCLDSSL